MVARSRQPSELCLCEPSPGVGRTRADGSKVEVRNTPELRGWVLGVAEQIRAAWREMEREIPVRRPAANFLRQSGCEATVEEFRRVLAEVKAEKYPDMTDEDLAFTKNEATAYCAEVNRRLGTKLGRVFILKCLVGIRKARKRRARAQTAPVSSGVVPAP